MEDELSDRAPVIESERLTKSTTDGRAPSRAIFASFVDAV
jgi:hypothetical protein